MKTSRLLLAAMLASAIGAPIDTMAEDKSVAQPMTRAAVQLARRRRVAFSGRRDRVAQFAAVDGERPARKSRPDRRLDLYLHQLAAHASLCPRVGREIQESGAGGDRRALARVRIRTQRRQRSPGREGHAGRLSDRDRQRLCDMARAQQPTIGRPSISSMRRDAFGIINSARANTTSRKGSFSNCWPRPEQAASVRNWLRSMPAVRKSPPIGTI